MTEGVLRSPLPLVNDIEADGVPDRFGRVIDAHVHLFPDKLFTAVWNWFDEFGWPIRYRMRSRDLITFLLSRGVSHVVAFQYAHRPGISRDLNAYMADIVRRFSGSVTGMATLFPGEEGAVSILEKGFDMGLAGLKLHVHVQCFDMTGPEMEPVYETCVQRDKPLVIHAGREPKSPAYACDPHELCAWQKVNEVLEAFPGLRLCIPHLGMDEFDAYKRLVEAHDTLWLDTAMALTDYLPMNSRPDLSSFRPDRVMYGSDFPNIPYAWDRELSWLDRSGLSPENLEQVLWKNAVSFFGIDGLPAFRSGTSRFQGLKNQAT